MYSLSVKSCFMIELITPIASAPSVPGFGDICQSAALAVLDL